MCNNHLVSEAKRKQSSLFYLKWLPNEASNWDLQVIFCRPIITFISRLGVENKKLLFADVAQYISFYLYEIARKHSSLLGIIIEGEYLLHHDEQLPYEFLFMLASYDAPWNLFMFIILLRFIISRNKNIFVLMKCA